MDPSHMRGQNRREFAMRYLATFVHETCLMLGDPSSRWSGRVFIPFKCGPRTRSDVPLAVQLAFMNCCLCCFTAHLDGP